MLVTQKLNVCPKGGGDCNDLDPLVHPGQKETCNDTDDNCSGEVDEGCDKDGDGYCNAKMTITGEPKVCPKGGGDCNDSDSHVFPGATEFCDGIDQSCDGKTDEGCDGDGDGFCDAGRIVFGKPTSCPKGGGDCDDSDKAVFPGQKELCNAKDDDCNGLTDADDGAMLAQDPQLCEKQKGVCTGAKKPTSLCVGGSWLACATPDYQSFSPYYATSEICDDKDNDCDGAADTGCDDDGDSYCDAAMSVAGKPLSCPKGGGDCDDAMPSVYPGATENCDAIDNNCDGNIDEGCDEDKDGYCTALKTTVGTPPACNQGGGDCDDTKASVHPGAADLCNGVDDNCSGKADEGFATLGQGCIIGLGECMSTGKLICAVDGKDVACDAPTLKAATEICDEKDNDCNGQTDEGCDDDADGYCDAAMAVVGTPKVCPQGGGDCDDTKLLVHPGQKEICDGLDDDCDGKTDATDGDIAFDDPQPCELQLGACKGAQKPPKLCVGGKWLACDKNVYGLWSSTYATTEICDDKDNDCNGNTDEICDKDGDGRCDKDVAFYGLPKVCVYGGGDCDDNNAAIYPNATEICDDVDNNCNGQVDEKCDKDGDAFCDAKMTTIGTPKVCLQGGGDCNDGDKLVHPSQAETCANFIDDNCDGQTDEGCPPTITGFNGELGPNYTKDGYLQCAGYFDKAGSDDIPWRWGLPCAGAQWNAVRVVCGANAQSVRFVDVSKNVFRDGIQNDPEYGLISGSNFDLLGNNAVSAFNKNFNQFRSWFVTTVGCDENSNNLTVNNTCTWEARFAAPGRASVRRSPLARNSLLRPRDRACAAGREGAGSARRTARNVRGWGVTSTPEPPRQLGGSLVLPMAVDGATGGFGEVPAGDLVDSVVTGSVGLGCGDYDFKEEAPKSFTLQSADDIKPTLKQALSGFAAWAVSSWSSLPDGGAIGLPYPGSQPEEW